MRSARRSDLGKVYAAVGRVLDEETPTRWKLKAYRYYHLPDKQSGLAGVVTADRRRPQASEKTVGGAKPP
jgi:hypothetical protein